MTTLKIAFGDLRHETIGSHSTSAPCRIGYIATYLESKFPDIENNLAQFETKLFDDLKDV